MKKGDRQQIVVTEIPYQLNKTRLLERIAELVRDKALEGISDLRDESDRDGMRIVIELKRGEVAEVVLNNLFKQTQLQQSFGIITLAIVAGRPKVLSLLEVIEHFIHFRREVVRRRIEFELKKAEARAHILEGLKIALDHLDAVIKLIRGSKNPPEAKTGLVTQFGLTEIQAQAILDMQLQRLTGLERDKILGELAGLHELIAKLKNILANQPLLLKIILDELRAVKAKFADPRRTQLIDDEGELSIEDLITEEDVAVTVTDTGYIKRTPITTYRTQNRGGKGRIGMRTREEDIVNHLFVASTHAYMMIFTDRGRAYWLKVHEVPDVGVDSKGKSIANLVQMESGEKLAAMLAVQEFDDQRFIVMGTRKGTIKKTELSAFSNPRAGGIIAMGIEEGDEVIDVQLSDGSSEIFIGTRDGKAIRFGEDDVRSMGRTAYGVRGIQLRENDEVVAMQVAKPGGTLLTVTEKGYAKNTLLDEYRVTGRGGLGVKNVEVTDKNGQVVAIAQIHANEELLVMTEQGKILRTPANEIRTVGRATQGVKLMDLEDEDKIVSVALVDAAVEESPAADAAPPAEEPPAPTEDSGGQNDA
jgi:DNA gyrase subunit A